MSSPEVWLRGPLPDVIPELQPVAHSLLQVREEIAEAASVSAAQLWARPGGAASIGFHLMHLAGSLDRLLTYARADAECRPAPGAGDEDRDDTSRTATDLVTAALTRSIGRSCGSNDGALRWTKRVVGRARLPSRGPRSACSRGRARWRRSAQIITMRKVIGCERSRDRVG
jgi:hypothetical protein